mgnify:CR=1 FL=1
MTEIKSLWAAQDLAVRLGTTRRTINTLRWQIGRGLVSDDRLPPPLNIGGRPRWDPDLVEDWIRFSSKSPQNVRSSTSKPKTGRKRLSTQPPIRIR